MADEARTKQQGLQQAASVIFALVAVVPLLMAARDPKGDVVACSGGGTAVVGSSADVVAGTTVTSKPFWRSKRRMFSLIP